MVNHTLLSGIVRIAWYILPKMNTWLRSKVANSKFKVGGWQHIALNSTVYSGFKSVLSHLFFPVLAEHLTMYWVYYG